MFVLIQDMPECFPKDTFKLISIQTTSNALGTSYQQILCKYRFIILTKCLFLTNHVTFLSYYLTSPLIQIKKRLVANPYPFVNRKKSQRILFVCFFTLSYPSSRMMILFLMGVPLAAMRSLSLRCVIVRLSKSLSFWSLLSPWNPSSLSRLHFEIFL